MLYKHVHLMQGSGVEFKNKFLVDMWSSSEDGSYLRLVYHSTLGLRVIKKKKKNTGPGGG